MPIGLDSESSYTKDRDIRSLGASRYITHPETTHYLVSLWSPELQIVCSPDKVPWDRLQGETLLSHNRSYDLRVIEHVAPPLKLENWHCTADLAAYLQCPRSLKDAGRLLLKEAVSKEIRDDMKGKDFATLPMERQAEVRAYALKDAQLCWRLWDEYGARMPENEMALSAHTTLMAVRGIGLDLKRIEEGVRTLRIEREKSEAKIPWADGNTPVTSPKALALECRKLGIEPPVSTDAKSDEFDIWAKRYAAQVPMVEAVQEWRSINRTLKVLEAMQVRQAGGVLPVELKYFGASHTGRWAGAGGLNLQNLPRKPVFGVDCRSMLVPRNGNKFIVADYSQIEARVLLWLAGDEKMLEMLRAGLDLYEASARKNGTYTDPKPMKEGDPEGRQFEKCKVLGLGYGLGPKKFQKIVQQWTGMEITEQKAKRMVDQFRRGNPKILSIWNKLDRGAKNSVGGSFFCQLPSGRQIEYFNVRMSEGDLVGRVERGEHVTKLWGGKLTENLVQATARDILADAILRLEEAGLPIVLHVHDEIVVEAPGEALAEVKRIMEQAPEWAEGCPITVDAHVCDRYEK